MKIVQKNAFLDPSVPHTDKNFGWCVRCLCCSHLQKIFVLFPQTPKLYLISILDETVYTKNFQLLCYRMAKVAITKGVEVPIENGFEIEKQCYSQLLSTQDRVEGLAAFATKRVPVYRGV